LTIKIDHLELRGLIEGVIEKPGECLSTTDYSMILKHMRELSHFAISYKRLFGMPVNVEKDVVVTNSN